MDGKPFRNDFVTPGRVTLATNYARELAEKEPGASVAACAEKAVRLVFGRWLQDPTAAIHPAHLPLFFQLVGRVESQMGVHRAPRNKPRPWHPGSVRMRMAAPQRAVV